MTGRDTYGCERTASGEGSTRGGRATCGDGAASREDKPAFDRRHCRGTRTSGSEEGSRREVEGRRHPSVLRDRDRRWGVYRHMQMCC